MEHHLLLMRHAKSDWGDGALADFDRPLSARGERDAPRMGAWLAAQAFAPRTIVSSPALRARQTALAVAAALGRDEDDIAWAGAVYGADVQALLYALAEHGAADGPVLLVGHNPGLEELLVYLAGSALPATGGHKLMPTAALAHLISDLPPGSLAAGGARCLAIQRPKQLP